MSQKDQNISSIQNRDKAASNHPACAMSGRLIVPIFSILLIAATFFVPSPAANAANRINSTERVLESASELDYPPFALVREDGSADGFSVELLKAVIKVIGLKIHFFVAPWNQLKQQLSDGQLDVLPLASYSEERDKIFDFTAPYLRMHGTIFVRDNEKAIRGKADLKDKEVIVMRGDTAHEYAVKNELSDNLILTDSFEEAMKMLSMGEHDAVLIQQLVGLQLIKKLRITNVVDIAYFKDASLKIVDKPLSGFEQKFCFAVKDGDKKLLALLNEGLAIVIADGTYDKLYDKWFSPILQNSVPFKLILKYLLFILVPFLFLILIGGFLYLKQQVAVKTKDLREEIAIRRRIEQEREKLIQELKKSIQEIKKLSGLLPICASCKKIRDDRGYWNQIESYIRDHSEAEFTHGICPECKDRLYPELNSNKKSD